MAVGAPTLASMALRSCIQNVDRLKDVGDIPYELIRPVLKKIRIPQQLRDIEFRSPQIAGRNEDLWRAFIARDVPNWQEKIMEPKNPASWWKVYRKLMREESKAKAASEEQLLATMSGIQQQKDLKTPQYVNRMIPDPKGYRQQEHVIAGKGNLKTCRAGSNWKDRAESIGTGQVDKKPSLKNAKTGKQILSAIRRQSAQATKERGLGRVQPANAMLATPRQQITRPPRNGIEDHKRTPTPTARPAQNTTPTSATPATQSKNASSSSPASSAVQSDGFRSALKAIEGANPPPNQTSTIPVIKRRPVATSIFMPTAKKRRM